MNRKSIPTQIFFTVTLIALLVLQACRPTEPPVETGPTLAQISGKWIRVESNNPVNDFIRIEVVGANGTITDKAGSGFSDGDIKWANITPALGNQFTYQELGSDYNYYDATMTRISDNELSLSVASSGAGNSQKWIRDDGTLGPAETATVLDCNFFTEDRVLENTPSAVDYIVPNNCVMDITKSLVIEPGVVIEVEENGGFGVYDQGTFKAVGTADEPIIIRGVNESRGYWRGIHIETNSINNQFDYVEISDAGSNYVYCCNQVASVFLKGGKLSIKNTTISNGENVGIYANEQAEFAEFANNTVTSHGEAAMLIHLERAAELDGTGSDFTGNDENYVSIFESTVDEELTVPSNNVPYLMEGKVMDLTEPVAFDPGVIIEFEENGGIGVYDAGALALNGTSSAPVILRGKEATKGYWRGIHIETNSSSNVFTYAEISDAGSEYVFCCNDAATVFLKGGKLSISNSTLSNGGSYGLYANKDASLATFSENTITTHNDYPLYMAADRFGELDGLDSDFSGNIKDFLGMQNTQVTNAMTWSNTNVPYRIESVIDIVEGLTIEAGTDIVFEEQGGLGIYDDGFINAEGSASSNILFRGVEPTQGYWRGIHIETNSSSNIFSYAQVLDAGSNYVYCCNQKANIFLKDGQATVENSVISGSGGCGIFTRSGATLTESGNTFSDNLDGNICQ